MFYLQTNHSSAILFYVIITQDLLAGIWCENVIISRLLHSHLQLSSRVLIPYVMRKAMVMLKVKHNDSPNSLTGLFCTVGSSADYNLRGENSKSVLPRPQTESLTKEL